MVVLKPIRTGQIMWVLRFKLCRLIMAWKKEKLFLEGDSNLSIEN